MARKIKSTGLDPEAHFNEYTKPYLRRADWILRFTEHTKHPAPVVLVKERRHLDSDTEGGTEQSSAKQPRAAQKYELKERGILYGDQLRRLLPVIRSIISRVQNEEGIHLELHRQIEDAAITFRGNLPLDEEAGVKLALIFKLTDRLKELERAELLARRVEKFTREEAAYWHSRIVDYGKDAGRWAQSGLRIVLAGQPKDPAVEKMLEKLRRS